MKKNMLLIAFTTLLFGCSNSGNTSSTNNGNSFTNSMDYEFTITINEEVHKIKGNTINGIPSQYEGLHPINNVCFAQNSIVDLNINDVTAPNYISGQNLQCHITLPNLLMGINQAEILFQGSYFNSICTSLGAQTNSFIYFQTVSGAMNNSRKLPIIITDLGTHSTWAGASPYNFGSTLKGNYSGTIYLQNSTNGNYTIPVQLSIDFKALRNY